MVMEAYRSQHITYSPRVTLVMDMTEAHNLLHAIPGDTMAWSLAHLRRVLHDAIASPALGPGQGPEAVV